MTRSAWALHAGRLVGYTAAGAVVAASVSGIAALGAVARVLRPLWTLLHVAALALGLYLARAGARRRWLSGAGRPAQALLRTQPVRSWHARRPRPGRLPSVSCWAVMPCGCSSRR